MSRLRSVPRRGGVRPHKRLTSTAVLPTVVTAGNLVAGFLAIAYLTQLEAAAPLADPKFTSAAWLIFIGMFCDAADGRIARMTHTASPFGAQMDSLADIVTFGIAPALLGKVWIDHAFADVHGRLLFGLSVVYVLGAAMRLARYNVEQGPGEGLGPTKTFAGLPTPAAAGVVAALVLLRQEVGGARLYGVLDHALLDWLILGLMPVLGYLMISRWPYPHLVNRAFDGARPLGMIVVLVLLLFFIVSYFQETVALGFLAYALSGFVLMVGLRLRGRRSWETDGRESVESEDALGATPSDPPEDGSAVQPQ